MAPKMKVARLTRAALSRVKALEKSLDVCVVAVEPETQFAKLNKTQLRALQDEEKKLGLVLLAYE